MRKYCGPHLGNLVYYLSILSFYLINSILFLFEQNLALQAVSPVMLNGTDGLCVPRKDKFIFLLLKLIPSLKKSNQVDFTQLLTNCFKFVKLVIFIIPDVALALRDQEMLDHWMQLPRKIQQLMRSALTPRHPPIPLVSSLWNPFSKKKLKSISSDDGLLNQSTESTPRQSAERSDASLLSMTR